MQEHGSVVDKTRLMRLSAKNRTGYEEFERLIKDFVLENNISFNSELIITNVRHQEKIIDTIDSLKLVINSIENDMPEDFLTIDLMSAYESLGNIIGEEISEDLVNEIFSKFCMGK